MDGRPWAHWKGKEQEARRETRDAHSCFVRGSLNIIAPCFVSLVEGGECWGDGLGGWWEVVEGVGQGGSGRGVTGEMAESQERREGEG